MRKLMALVVFVTMYSMCAAQVVTNVKSVKTVSLENKAQQFFVVVDSSEVQVSPLVYKIVEADPQNFCVVEVGDVKTVFLKSDLNNPTQYVFEVAKTDLVDNVPTVTMTNDYRFSDSDLTWLAVLDGQHVQISRYIGLTREIVVYETVSRSTALTTNVDVTEASAPAKSKLPMLIESVKAKAKAQAQALAMNSVTKAENTSDAGNSKEITFGCR